VNAENFYQPSQVTRNRTILHERRARECSGTSSAAPSRKWTSWRWRRPTARSRRSTPRSRSCWRISARRPARRAASPSNADPRHDSYTWNVPVEANNWFPTYRLDYNVTNNHRLSTVLNWHTFSSMPDTLNGFDPFFPGFPVLGSQTSRRVSSSNTVRSTFGQNVVNEARFAYQGSPVEFFNEQFDPASGMQPFGGQGGFHLTLGNGLSNAGPAPNAQSRNVNTYPCREHAELAEGLAQPQLRRHRSTGWTPGTSSGRRCRRRRSACSLATRRRGCSRRPTSRGPRRRNSPTRQPVRAADRACHVDDGQRACGCGDRPVRVCRAGARGEPARHLGRVRAGQLARGRT
jgi:hypothetical protein